jgi:protein-tyrosine phosphatase
VRTVLFLCLGNICRSPCFAAALEAEAARRRMSHAVRAASAGVAPWCGGRPAHPAMVAAAAPLGIDLTGHRSRRVDAELLMAVDLVVPLDAAVREILRRQFSGSPVPPLRMPVELGLSAADVPDPYGGPAASFATVAALAVDAARRLCGDPAVTPDPDR